MQLTVVFEWVEGLQIVRLIATVPGAYPTISALHVLGIGILVGSIAPVDFRLLGILGPKFDAVMSTLIRMALAGFGLAAASGLLLASVRIGSYAQNPAFLSKLAILAVAGGNAGALRLFAHGSDLAGMVRRGRGSVAAATSLVLWLAAVFAGRWIAFV
ncbi:MAG: hypothetical protein V7704_00110 [Aurantimonas endophytica]|uniref:hypothetical protein n=1 Tax=Aurantimonas endophytica TaxID=1522175 RepID=UPI003002F56D